MSVAIRRLGYKTKSWVAVGPSLHFVELYRPHMVKLANGDKGVKGRTPFEALYRYQRLTLKEGQKDA